MPRKRASQKAKSDDVFGRARKAAKMLRAGLYTRVSTNDQQTLAMQNRAMREYAARRGWTIALQVREVNSGAAKRKAREKLLDAARRREIDVVLVWRLDRWGRSVTDLLATLQELEHLGVGFVSLTEGLDLTTPAGRAMAGLLAIFAEFRTGDSERADAGRAGSRTADRQTARPAGDRGHPRRGNSETASRRLQQIRNCPAAKDRTNLGTPFWPDLFPRGIDQTRAPTRFHDFLIPEFAPNLLGKIGASGFRGKQLVVLMVRKLKVAINLATMESYIQLAFVIVVGHLGECSRIRPYPVHRSNLSLPFSRFGPDLFLAGIG
jgi:DNA invertase Pin-like site-specific DNA recombinase